MSGLSIGIFVGVFVVIVLAGWYVATRSKDGQS